MKKTKALQKVKKENTAITARNMTPEGLIARAIDKGDVGMIEKLLSMRRELKSERAKEEFIKALSDFQVECPIIKKTKIVKNKDGSIRYRFAPIDSILDQAKKLITKYGFSYSIDSTVDKEWVTAICKITHSGGHVEINSFKVPIYDSEYMNNDQRFASSLTFAKRYAFCNGFGILTGDEDDSAQSTGGTRAEKTENLRTKIDEMPNFDKPAPVQGPALKPAKPEPAKPKPEAKPEEKLTELQKQDMLFNLVMEMQGGELQKANEEIKNLSSFISERDGKPVVGPSDVEKLHGKWLNMTLHKAKEKYKEWKEKQERGDDEMLKAADEAQK